MRVLITGITGMDGSHLAEILAEAGHDVWGMIRDPDAPPRNPTAAPYRTVTGDLLDSTSLRNAIDEASPQVVFHLGAISSPSQAWVMPELTTEVTGLGTLRLLAAAADLRGHDLPVVVAGSIAAHGPYGAAKTYAAHIAEDYRSRGYPVTTVQMGGHHSPRRGASYLSQKVARHAGMVANRLGETGGNRIGIPRLKLGWLGRVQDWGWAPDFMQVWSQLPEVDPGHYVLSTGVPIGVGAYVAECYHAVGLKADDWVDASGSFGAAQPVDVHKLSARTSPALQHLIDPLASFDNPQAFFRNVLVPEMVGAWLEP